MSTKNMVETQIKPRGVRDPLVLRAMETVPRERFVPASYRNLAFADCPLPIQGGQTISQPYMVAAMTELLQVGPESRVLEIGTGSGYQTAVLAEVVTAVFTVEIIESLALCARQLLGEIGYTNIQFKIGDGHLGWPEHGPYDGIIVTAAPVTIPQQLVDQLKPNAKMVIPVGPVALHQELLVVDKNEDGTIHSQPVMPVRFVPLTGGD